jgi:hypothetical protein
MHEDLARLVDEERKTFAADIDRLDHRNQCLQRKIAAGDACELAVLLHRRRGADDQVAAGGVDVGIGQHASVGLDRVLIPGALARIVTFRHRHDRPSGEFPGFVADIGADEFLDENIVVQGGLEPGLIGGTSSGIGNHRRQCDAAVQPVGDALGSLLAGGGNVLLDRAGGHGMLEAVNVNGKAGKGGDDDERRGDKNARHQVRSFGQLGFPYCGPALRRAEARSGPHAGSATGAMAQDCSRMRKRDDMPRRAETARIMRPVRNRISRPAMLANISART